MEGFSPEQIEAWFNSVQGAVDEFDTRVSL